MAALDGALALGQVHHAAGRVGQELDLDVARGLEPAFEEDLVVAERAPGLAAGRLDGLGQVGRVADHPHADPAAAVGRLDHQGEADPLAGVAGRAGHRLAGEHRHPGGGRDPLGLELVAEGGQHLGGRPDEGQAALAAAVGELGALGQEPVAGVDGVGAGALGRVQDGLEVAVGVGGAEGDGLVGQGHERGVAVGGGEHGHGGDAHGPGGAQDPGGDLAPVGDQQLGDHIRNTP